MEIDQTVLNWYESMEPASIEGPIKITEASWPFCSMSHCRTPWDLKESGYLEEEYFVSGKAAVYEKTGALLKIVQAPRPYTTRILIRRPADPAQASGRVYMEILNATNQYDFEDLWQRIYRWCVQNHHTYIGITSKPCNIQSLKKFDPERYRKLTWPSYAGPSLQPPYSSMEEGAFWDILTQTAELLRFGADSPLKAYPLKWWYLAGQSQSGAYLNTYLANFYPVLKASGLKTLYNGFVNLVGVQFARGLGQESLNLKFQYREAFHTDIPYLGITCEGDYSLFGQFDASDLTNHCPLNSSSKESKCRYYEIGGAPHFDILCPVILSDDEIHRAGGTPLCVPPKTAPLQNDFPLREYIVALLDKLHRWVTEGLAPEEAPSFEKDAFGRPKHDSVGNVLGGLRSPYLDVPAAQYVASNPSAGQEATGLCLWMSREAFSQRYGNLENYLKLFREAMEQQIKDGWLLPEDGKRLLQLQEQRVRERYS